MAKKSSKSSSRSRKSSSSNRTTTSVLGFILILAAVLVAQFLGVDVLNTPEDGDDSNNTAPVIDDTGFEGSWYTVYFTSPINTNDAALQVNSPVENAMVDAINSATRSIDGAMYEINLPRVTEALIAAHQRNVQVRLVLDDEYAIEDEDSTYEELEEAGIPIVSDDRSAFMHHKFLVIDRSAVWAGSTNFTRNDVYNNNNNALFIRSSRLAENYTAEFEEMFVDGNFSARDNSRQTPNQRLTIDGVQVENYFSPEDGNAIEARLVELINGAQTSVYTMALSYTLDTLADAMISQYAAGRDVKAVFDSTGSLQGAMRPMGCANIPVKQDGNPNRLHSKVIIIDGQIVVTGSFNFSDNAIRSNSENLLIIYDAQLAAQYTAQFNDIFDDPRAKVPTAAQLSC
jgi:phosphatidylserine/phosphatidylglycerophosphate/cardiolipin synthase-like enzyme